MDDTKIELNVAFLEGDKKGDGVWKVWSSDPEIVVRTHDLARAFSEFANTWMKSILVDAIGETERKPHEHPDDARRARTEAG